ncbi:sporulation protein YunB [Alicyclobacillus cycloheptanicus]|uniref:Sporulation protein YunB n=1 Tax=Alicyclobacillus cycloheptanicus TaxID=1457 RepID=A0ABT9XF49_9BACL|nr:sporulation protein YunB [Alicyclobacillus cycloheptanicus]MDQ0188750.1 sporulation protein YunB [Alicyclobacillus cycloheptanicus]WDM00590.1 sporulation protein YunB [Alicyclobacillus cycloheptanicus]
MAAGRFRAARRGVRIRVSGSWSMAACLLGLLALAVHMMEVKVRPIVAGTAQAIASRAATEALNGALTEDVAAFADTDKFIHIERDQSGRMEVATFDFAAVTKLQSAATAHAQEALRQLQHESFALPMGDMFGSSLLSAAGPKLPVRFTLMGSAHSSVITESRTVGINQTVHTMYLELTARVNVITPFSATPTTVESKMPIAYVVFGGEVPHTYLQGNGTFPAPLD